MEAKDFSPTLKEKEKDPSMDLKDLAKTLPELKEASKDKEVSKDKESKGYYDEIEIEDMDFDEAKQTYYFPCPCGDRFQITRIQLEDGEDVASCPSCSLKIKVIYDPEEFENDEDDDD